MKVYHLEWTDTGSYRDPKTGDEMPEPIPVDSYAFIENNFILEFAFGQSGERVQVFRDDSVQVETIVREFQQIKSLEIDQNTKRYMVQSLFERELQIK